ncbi:MAG: FAD-binding protein [Desulfitobacterium sp.]
MSDMDRRGFLKKAAIGTVAAVAGTGLLSGCNSSTAAPKPEVPVDKNWDVETDIVVAGAGIGGLCAAMAAAEKGVKVIMLEASGILGGTALFSGGGIHVWGEVNYEDMKARIPLLDPVLGKVMMDNWDTTYKWLAGIKAPWQDIKAAFGTMLGENACFMGPDYQSRQATADALGSYFESLGGEIQRNTKAVKLFANEDGKVTGIRVLKDNKTYVNIKSKAVVLATGGFSNNPEMRVKYYGQYADSAVSRSVPYNRGEAFLMASEVGALMSRSFGTAYGHVQSYPCIVPQTDEEYEKFDKDLLRALMGAIQGFTAFSLAVNIYGKRFIDESLGDDLLNMEICKQEEGRVFVLLDSETAKIHLKNIELIKANGGVVITEDTIQGLVQKMAGYGYDAEQLQLTIDEFNKAVDSERTKYLAVPRIKNANKLHTGPFYAIQATAGISGPYGGIKINSNAQAIGRGEIPIPGLYAAPHAAGGIFAKHYGGSLGLCAAFGRIAGQSAAAGIQA